MTCLAKMEIKTEGLISGDVVKRKMLLFTPGGFIKRCHVAYG